MALTDSQKADIENVLKNSLRHKFHNYNPEPSVMPFHTRLLGKDRMALFSFIHSLNTNFGTTIFEPVALALASTNFSTASSQVKVGGRISERAQFEIQRIMDDLTAANIAPDKINETNRIREFCQTEPFRAVKATRADIFLKDHENRYFIIDLKTAKPNKGGFKEFKRTLLEWTAIFLADNPDADVNTIVAIPYNPYEPKPYARWTIAGMLDLGNELKVAEELWDFLGGVGTYNDLLDCFERVGIELKQEIDEYFQNYNNQ